MKTTKQPSKIVSFINQDKLIILIILVSYDYLLPWQHFDTMTTPILFTHCAFNLIGLLCLNLFGTNHNKSKNRMTMDFFILSLLTSIAILSIIDFNTFNKYKVDYLLIIFSILSGISILVYEIRMKLYASKKENMIKRI